MAIQKARLLESEDTGVCVRQAELDEIATIQGVAGVCWRHTYRDILSRQAIEHFLSRAYSDFSLRQTHAAGGLLVLELGGTIGGYLRLSEERGAGYLGAIYLLPEVQGQGHGRQLWEAARAWFLARGSRDVTLTVAAQNEKARGFYRRLGFEEMAVITSTVAGEPLEEITCRLPLYQS